MSSETNRNDSLLDNVLPTADINSSDFPRIIDDQVGKLNSLSIKVEEAVNRANKEKQAADNAAAMKINWLGHGKKVAIEELQKYAINATDASLALVDAQKESFEFQKQLANISTYLFCLGASSIALNRSTIRQLSARFDDASKGKLSELARSELNNVIRQLRAQQDILFKLEKLDTNNMKQNELIQGLIEKHECIVADINRHNELIQSLTENQEECLSKYTLQSKKFIEMENNIAKILDISKTFIRYNRRFFLIYILIGSALILSIASLILLIIK